MLYELTGSRGQATDINRWLEARSTREPMTATGTGHTVIDVGAAAAAVGEVGEK